MNYYEAIALWLLLDIVKAAIAAAIRARGQG